MLYKCGKLVDHNQAMLKILGVFFLQKKRKNTTALCHNQLIIQVKSFFDPLSTYQCEFEMSSPNFNSMSSNFSP